MPWRTKSSRRARGRPPGHAKVIAPNPFVALLTSVKRDVDLRLEGFFADQLESTSPHGPEVAAMVASIARLSLRGGKRLRPALLAAGFRVVAPAQALEPALDAGVALELLHTYLLVHDDWMDGDAMRRGGPAVHTELAKRFKDERRGHASAILAGDFAAALATLVISRVRAPEGRHAALFEAFARMQHDVILGQQLDVASPDHDPEAIYALKTGSYTVTGPLCMGALLGGSKPSTLRALAGFGAPVGIAFQLADDLLSAFGDPRATGKALGNDLRAGKRTPLVLEALRRARGLDRRKLTDVFGKRRASDAQVRKALLVLEQTGARRKTETRIGELVQAGIGALDKSVPRQGRELLEGAALALTARRV
jgi:geranylgeranyl diphosphate synthase, type I